jgi:putative peptidoglycan lipid II flippase
VLLLALPIAVIVATYSTEIVALVFERGAFGAGHARITSQIVYVLAASIPFVALRDVYLRAMYAFQSPHFAATASLAALGINVGLSYLLLKALETTGLAIAVVLASIGSCLICYALVLRSLSGELEGAFVRFCLKLGLLTAVLVTALPFNPVDRSVDSAVLRLLLGAMLILCGFLGGYFALGFLRFNTRLRSIHRGY